ncbi:MAG: hypothetical protein AAGL89_06260 [Pseudomonadota bacterium]
MALFQHVKTAFAKRAAFERTRRELAAVPADLALEDLGYYPGDADKIAAKAIYG